MRILWAFFMAREWGILAFAKVSSLVTRTPDNSAFRVTSKPKRTRQAKRLPCPFWRRRRDSNPRGLSPKRFSRPPRYDRFDTPAFIFYLSIILGERRKVNRFCGVKIKSLAFFAQGILKGYSMSNSGGTSSSSETYFPFFLR